MSDFGRIVSVLWALGACASAAPPGQPNVIIILADDQGYADLGAHGLKQVATPNIDSIARDGVRCTNAYVSGPYCSPTRAGLLTGRYQQRFGHEFNPHRGDPNDLGLPTDETTFANRMKELGYATGTIGKWHLGITEKFHPLSRGFDEFYGFVGGARSYYPTKGADKVDPTDIKLMTFAAPIESRHEPVKWDDYLTEQLGAAAVDFVDRHQKEPFFLYLAFNAVHTPMEATDEHLARVPKMRDRQRRTYLAMLVALDDAVGEVLRSVADAGIEKRTLIVFLSDNGGPIGDYAPNGSVNEPLRGAKGDTWEGGIRVPFLVRWPGTLPAGEIYEKPIIQLDLLPTAVAAAGGTVDPEWKLDGVNLLPYLKGEQAGHPHETLYWRMGDNWAIRHGNFKAVGMPEAGEPELFDLKNDIGESHNLRCERPSVYSDLRDRYEAWNRTLAEPRWPAR